jgi:hypothetical protein
MEMNPTGWGWVTILSVVALVGSILWAGHSTTRTKALAWITVVCVALFFAFAFMQWATWYK